MRRDSGMAKWTREQIVREILRREAAGLPLNLAGEQGVDSSLYRAGSRFFGTWRNAVMAAGIPPERAKVRDEWPPSRVVAAIRSLSRRRHPPNPTELQRRYSQLVRAAQRHFGSWTKAAVAAGVDPAKLKRTPLWTKDRIIEAILMRALNNEPLGSRTVRPRSLADAGARVFGSWRASLAAAGVDLKRQAMTTSDSVGGAPVQPVSVGRQLGHRWSEQRVLQAILARLREHRKIDATSVHEDDSCLYWAAKGWYGSWRKALLAAGLDSKAFRR